MNDEEYNRFVNEANAYLKEKNDNCEHEFDIGHYKRFDLDQEHAELTFSVDGVRKIKARVQIVGSISKKSKTWLWAWANSSILDSVKTEMSKIKQFGEINNIDELSNPKWIAEEEDGWAMAAITAKILNAQGAYRIPSDTASVFVIFTEVNRIGDNKPRDSDAAK